MTRYRRFFALVVMMSIGAMAIAQVSYPNQKLIEKGDFEKAANKIEKALAEDPSALDYYAAYVLYGATSGPYANLDRAYNQLKQCQTVLRRLDEKEKEKLAKKGLTDQQLDADFALLCSRAVAAADAAGTMEAYNHFLTSYAAHATSVQKEWIVTKRNHLAFTTPSSRILSSPTTYMAEKNENGWSDPQKLDNNLNPSSWQADAILTSDGQHILFAAEKKTDHEIESSTNIFISHQTSDGDWSVPESLGPVINTPGMDRSPFIHPDMHTLYFASNRHSSLGELDIFVSHRLSDSSWIEWSEPISLGKEINTIEGECFYQISTDGKTAYFSKEINNNQDIYSLNLPPRLRPNFVATIEGKLIGKDNKPIAANIRWEDLETQQVIGQIKSDPTDGSYFIVLPLGKNYGYYVDNDDYFPLSNNLDLRKADKAVTIEGDIKTISIKEMVEEGIAVPMNNLFFDTGKWNQKAESRNELKRVASIINKQNVKVEISGHTDDVGTDENNQELSEKRAQSVRQYLIDHCGCQADKLIAVGYGKTRPVVPNDSEKNRKLNRRVEMRFVE